ncbi:hypothetical protein DFH11DRAFT_1842373 [Phellopilus nigrolimitatus]|nr:hypothetical protein DFH11DRAFT_1842373 [Phellopilus nigrolimitatus]
MQRDPNEKHDEPIQMDEGEDLVKALLDAIYPDRALAPSDITSFEFMHDLAVIFIEKYDVPAGMFGLAAKFGWVQETALASSATLALDMHTPDSQAQLETLNGRRILQLLSLHRDRRLIFLRDLKSESEQIRWRDSVTHYYNCSWQSVFGSLEWIVFLHAVSEELEKCSLGTGLKDAAFWARPDISRLWEVPCNPACNAPVFKKDDFIKAVCEALDNLPKTIKTLPRSDTSKR